MQNDRYLMNRFSFLRALLLLLAFVFVGCSGGSDNGGTGDFVFTGTNAGNTNNAPGSMTFNFVRAQAPIEVPANTNEIRFRFYSAANGNGTLLQEETRPFANSITVDPVNGATQSVVITALGPDGYPTFQSTVNAAVSPGQDVVVDFGSATTEAVTINALFINPPSASIAEGGTQQFTASLSFSNGEVLPADNVMWSADGQASVDVNTGLVTATTSGVATVTATRNSDTATANIVVGDGPVLTTLTVTPDGIEAGVGSNVQFTATGVDQNGDNFPLTNVVWSIEAGTGSIDSNGLANFPSVTTATVRATVGTVFDEAGIDILATVPTVVFSGSTLNPLVVLSTESPNIVDAMGEVTVTDDQTTLQGGTLRIALSAPGNVFDASLNVPATTIGTISNNNTNNVSVLLGPTAGPAEIAALIESTTISFGGTLGTGTIRVTLSDGNGNNAIPATRAFSIPDPIPQLALDSGALIFDVNDTPTISTAATVSDDRDPAASGTLSFTVTGTANDAIFTVPAAPSLGTISNNGTASVSIALAGAGLSDIATVINTTTLRFSGTKGTGTIQVSFTDQDGNSASATRGFEITPLNLTVGVDKDHQTITAAIAEVRNTTGATGSTITVDAGDFTGEARLSIANDPDLVGLTLRGAASGQSAGVDPATGRTNLTLTPNFAVGAGQVTIDGVDVINPPFFDGFDISGADCNIINCVSTRATSTASAVSVRPGADRVTIANCRFSGWGIGVFLQYVTDLTVTSNSVTGVSSGIVFFGNISTSGSENISGNGFSANTTHVNALSRSTATTFTLRSNSFEGGIVTADSNSTLDVQSNWWGQASGPSMGQTQTSGTGVVDSTNFLTADPHPNFP